MIEVDYRIDNVPVGQYVPAAIAPGYDETVALDSMGVPRLVSIEEDVEAQAQSLGSHHACQLICRTILPLR